MIRRVQFSVGGLLVCRGSAGGGWGRTAVFHADIIVLYQQQSTIEPRPAELTYIGRVNRGGQNPKSSVR